MNTIIAVLDKYVPGIEQGIVFAVEIYLAANPGVSAEQAVTDTEGQIKHLIREKIGVFVDFGWPWIEPVVHDAVVNAVSGAKPAEVVP